MKIKDIKNKGLRELAESRVDKNFCLYYDFIETNELIDAFDWMGTAEGTMFWDGVDNGVITELPKGSEENKQNYIDGKTPSYYTGKYKGIKVIDFIYDFELNHNKASAVEYIARSGKKDDEIQDLTKAINHLQMYIEFLKNDF